MSGKIFISYRRDDSRYQARMIYEAFLRGMPRENVFMDIDTIPLGVNFVKVLEGWVEQCEVLLVLMGAGWANSTDPKTGKRRLDNPKDFVRLEIRGALTRDIPVVPVILDGAEIPDEAQLPDDIKGLLTRNAEFVEYRNFDADVQRLLKKLGVGVSAKQTAAPATIAGTQRAQAIQRSTRSSAEDFETQGDLADKAQAKKPLGKEWKRWLTPTVVAIVLLAAAVIGALVFWSPGPIGGKKAEVAADSVERARRAAEAQAADAETARQAAETKAAEAIDAAAKSAQARRAAEAQAADAEKARQAAEAQAADAEKAREAAEKTAQAAAAEVKSEQARRAAEAQAADAEKARQAAAAKAADARLAALAEQEAARAKAAAERAEQEARAKAAAELDAYRTAAPRPPPRIPEDIQEALQHRGHALLIGDSRYTSDWDKLPSVRDDLQALKAGLKDHFETVETMLDPTVSQLRDRMREFLLGKWNMPDERLFIYYAGHGFTDFNQASRENNGYITGSDTPRYDLNPRKAIENALPFTEIDSWSLKTRVRHVLMVFDSCFSGTLFQTMGSQEELRRKDLDGIRRMLGQPIRYYITSCRKEEKVTDDSTFVTLLLRGLVDGAADFFHQGLFSADQLGIYLSREVPRYSQRSQTPQFSHIDNANLSEGQFFFLTGIATTR